MAGCLSSSFRKQKFNKSQNGKRNILCIFFTPDRSDWGAGIAVFRDGFLNGGDHGYTYQGRFIRNEYDATLEAIIDRWNPEVESVFGNLQNYKVKFSGTFSSKAEKTIMTAELSDDPLNTITVELTYLKPLDE